MEQTTAFLSLMIFKSWILNEVEIMYANLVLYKEYFFLAYFVYLYLTVCLGLISVQKSQTRKGVSLLCRLEILLYYRFTSATML